MTGDQSEYLLSEERIASIQKGIADAHAERVRPLEDVVAELDLDG